MLNSLTENKSVWHTDFSQQETIFYTSCQNCNIFVLAEEFSAGDLKILSEDRQPRGICYYYHLCLQMENLMLEKLKILLKIKERVRDLWEKGEEQIPSCSKVLWLHQTSPKSVILYLSSHFVFASNVPMDTVFGNYHTKSLKKRSKSSQIILSCDDWEKKIKQNKTKTTKTNQKKAGHYGSYSESPTAKSQTLPLMSKNNITQVQ